MSPEQPVAVVAGLGPGLSAAVCRRLAADGYAVVGLARSEDFGQRLAAEIAAAGGVMEHVPCDVTDSGSVEEAFYRIGGSLGSPSVLVYTAGAFEMKPIAETSDEDFDRLWRVNCRGAFLCARQAVPAMLEHGHGAIVFAGATASVKPGARFAAFGASKYGLRGLAMGMARELGPKGIHVAHVIIDGVIWTERTRAIEGLSEENSLDPEAMAGTFAHLIAQDRSAWTLELDLRPDVEPF